MSLDSFPDVRYPGGCKIHKSQIINQLFFQDEQNLYLREGLNVEAVTFVDNQVLIDPDQVLQVQTRYYPRIVCYRCLPCNHCSNRAWVVKEILAFGNRLRSTHCRRFPLFETMQSADPLTSLELFNYYITLAMSSGRICIWTIQLNAANIFINQFFSWHANYQDSLYIANCH